ncbi:MAG: CotH kinase family protein [Candidatus Omnitrophica bacterium]|nr:CotH kinase family protein [Candidatus Omnitrophota bacterium]
MKNILNKRWVGFYGFIFIIVVFISHQCSSEIEINELLAQTSNEDSYGTPIEWVEIYNPGPDSVNLVNYTLTDDPQNLRKWIFPSYNLEAGEYFLVLATGYGYYNPGEYHANFRLDADGEFLGVYRSSDLNLVDSLTYPAQEVDISFGRDPNDREQWLYFNPTPGESNSPDGVSGSAAPPEFSLEGGVYNQPQTIMLTSSMEGSEIRYTLDGSAPTQISDLYTQPIVIDQTTPIRARTFLHGYSPSVIRTNTYFINEEIRLAKLAITTDPQNLWDSRKGIYVNAARHGEDWERPACMEYIRPDGVRWFGVDAGLRIHGGASRDRSEKKSFRVYFRREFGPGRLKIPLIPDTPIENFDSFILRAGYNDSWVHWDDIERKVAVYISDQMGRDVHNDMGFISSHGIFAELYLNGEYWGLYNLCERYEGEFFESYYSDVDWDIISDDEVKEGDAQEWSRLINFVSSRDMRNDDNYQNLLSMIDVEQMTSYYILNIWVQNHDWPHHNWFAARERRDGGKWKLFVWDIEDSFGSGASRGNYTMDTFSNARQGGFLGTLFNALLQNDQYKLFFKEKLDYYLESSLNPSRLLVLLDELADQVRIAIPFEAQRWNQNKSLQDWEEALDIARTFINNRTAVVLDDVNRALRLPTPTSTPAFTPTPTPVQPTPAPGEPTVTPTPTPPLQMGELGIFEAHLDIGSVSAKGDASYNSQSAQYGVTGSGADIWGSADEFHFLYRKLEGDFILQGRLEGENQGASDWAKVTFMARETLSDDAKHFAARIQESNLQASSQWRIERGASAGSTATAQRINSDQHDGFLRLVREGDDFSTFYLDIQTNQFKRIDGQTIPMTDPIYVGLAVTSHDDGRYATGYYTHVSLQGPNVFVQNWMMY